MRHTVPRDHIDMNKFDSESDYGFQTVVQYIGSIVDNVRAQQNEVREAERQQESEADKKLREGPSSAYRFLLNAQLHRV